MYIFWNDLCNYLWLYVTFVSFMFVLLKGSEKNEKFVPRFVAYSCVYLIVSVVSSFIPVLKLSSFLRYASYSILLGMNIIIVPFLYKENKVNMVFAGFLITILLQTVRTVVSLFKELIKVNGALVVLRNNLLYLVVWVVCLVPIAKLLPDRMKEMTDLKLSVSFVLLFVSNAVLAMMFSFFIPFIKGKDIVHIVYIMFQIIYNVAMVGAILMYGHNTRLQAENMMIKYLWQRDTEQYKRQKEGMELINIKCHDLRFAQGKADGEALEAVADYDSFFHTGNDALDVAVNNTSSRCLASGIRFTCLADGKLLDFMNSADIFSMMSNILDNAVNCEETYDGETRFVSLGVKTRNNFTVIHCENFFDGDLKTENGLPLTDKDDKMAHGFGMKSIKRIVDKYNGILSICAQNSMFVIDIAFSTSRSGRNGEKGNR